MKLRNISYLLLLLSWLSIITVSCAKDIVDLQGNISGTVFDSRTHEPLSGVLMTLSPGGKTVATGAVGQFMFHSLEPGNYTLQAMKTDYKSDTNSVSVLAGETANVDFQLTPSIAGLSISQGTLDFGNTSTTLTLDLKNTGNAVLKWQASEDASWLTCIPASGEIQAGESASIVVNVDRTGLDRGSYSQTIAIASNGGSEVVKVNMSVQGVSMSVSPESLDFGSVASSMQMTLTNTGTGSISYTLSPNKDWVKVSKASGTFSTSEVITVSVNRDGFSEGNYEAAITIRVNDENRTVDVRMNIPSKEKPTVSLTAVSNETFNTAVFKGSVVTVGSSKVTARGFCWNTQENPDINNGNKCNLGDCEVAEDFSYTATSLNPSTEYYVRAYAENIEGIAYSNQIKFMTKGTPRLADIETGTVTAIQSSQALASGNILNLGNVDEINDYGHVWSLKANPTVNDLKNSLGRTSSVGTYNTTITGLEPNKTYHVRAYATNSVGTAYGKDVKFTTALADLKIKTSDVKNVTYSSAVCGGKITDFGGNKVTECGVCYALTSNPTIESNIAKAATNAATYSVTITGLKEACVYHVRAYAKTESGSIYYGDDIVFSTADKDVHIGIGGFGEDKNWTR